MDLILYFVASFASGGVICGLVYLARRREQEKTMVQRYLRPEDIQLTQERFDEVMDNLAKRRGRI